jgi:hypothetical protein
MKKNLLISAIFILFTASGFSQLRPASEYLHKEEYAPKMNLFKVNLTALPLNNFSFQYERVFTKRFSAAISYRLMPEGTIPFKESIKRQIDSDDPDTERIIDNFTLSNFAVTPEIRFYLGKKGYGRGFYIAPFFRYAGYEGNNFEFFYDDENNVQQSISLRGSIKSNTAGIMFGAQWSLGRHFLLDWWILGPHAGFGKGDLTGISSRTLTADEQDQLRENLEDFEIPLVKKTVSVNANGATMNLDGFWSGIRAGISFGFKF